MVNYKLSQQTLIFIRSFSQLCLSFCYHKLFGWPSF